MTTDNPRANAQVTRSKRVPAIIFGSLIFVILASTLLFRAAVNGQVDLPALLGTKNKGVLIAPPQRIADLPLQLAGGEVFNYDSLPKQWTLLIPVARHCDEQCQQTLVMTRQIHIALGKEASRVRRFLVATDYPLDEEFERLLADHPKLEVLKIDDAAFENFFHKLDLQPLRDRNYFVVDPNGWLMMYYNAQHNGKAVLADLKFLLTNSHEQEGKN